MVIKKFNTLTNELIKPIAFYNKPFDDSFFMEMHTHGYYEIMYCLEGSFSIQLLDNPLSKKITTINVPSNHIILFDSGVYHKLVLEKGTASQIINIEFVPIKQYTENDLADKNLLVINFEQLFSNSSAVKNLFSTGCNILLDSQNVKSLLLQLIDDLSCIDSNYEQTLSTQLQIYNLFSKIALCLKQDSGNTTGIVHIKNALDYIKRNFPRPISLDDIAKHTKINKDYLQRLFKEHYTFSIHKTINFFKIQEAQYLLKNSNFPLEKVASLVGFNSRQQFIYVFKSFTNQTPSAYKKEITLSQIDHQYDKHDSFYIKINKP